MNNAEVLSFLVQKANETTNHRLMKFESKGITDKNELQQQTQKSFISFCNEKFLKSFFSDNYTTRPMEFYQPIIIPFGKRR